MQDFVANARRTHDCIMHYMALNIYQSRIQMLFSGKTEEAETCFQRALKTVEAIAGKGHLETAFALGAYGAFYKYAAASLPNSCSNCIN